MKQLQAKATQAVTEVMGLNMLMWLTMLTLFAGLLCIAAAIYLALAVVVPAALAALIAGLVLLGICAALAIAISRAMRRATAVPAAATGTAGSGDTTDHSTDNISAAVGQRAGEWTREHSDIALAGAFAAGIALAVSPRLRAYAARTAGPLLARKLSHLVRDFTNH